MKYTFSFNPGALDDLKAAFTLGLDGTNYHTLANTQDEPPLGPQDDIPLSLMDSAPTMFAPSMPKATGSKPRSDDETQFEFKQRLNHYLRQMMFVSGETAEPSAETTWMIEEIVREQVLEMVSSST